MARCSTCSAPLPSNTNRCVYCQVRSDVDLHSKHDYTVVEAGSKRICPNCDKPLATINLNSIHSDKDKKFQIERCDSCFGLFFDPGEIEEFLEKSVSNVLQINKKHMRSINRDRYQKEAQIRYRKCPVCQAFMQRSNFGHRSGVIIDRCYQHGVWLNSGEITHLMEWKKAGGQLLHENIKAKQQLDKKTKKINHPPAFNQHNYKPNYKKSFDLGDELLDTISSLIFKLF
ncbi:MAG: zf-TFIIB domain-containing protein [Pseudomonadota bacterium]